MFFQELPIKKIEPILPEIFRVTLASAEIARHAQPGQFVMIKPKSTVEPLLPRPISIHRVRGARFDLLIRMVGQGTRRLSVMRAGEPLEVKGPLGLGFKAVYPLEPWLIAGGMGAAPLLFLAEKLNSLPTGKKAPPPVLLIGARTRRELLGLKYFKRTGMKVLTATEDGSLGRQGLVTDLLQEALDQRKKSPHLFVCGPPAMMKAVAAIALQQCIPCQVSLEARMACGMGACLGCAVAGRKDTGAGYVKVCQDGPVFEAGEISWDG